MNLWPACGIVVLVGSLLGSLPHLATSFKEDSVADLHAQLKYLATHLQNCYGRDSELFDMRRIRFIADKKSNVTCNDGTPAGYYLKKTPGSKRWIVYLEGGMFCYSPESCKLRQKSMVGLMTSDKWSATRRGSGILSPDPEENPHWWNANHVYVPYCSSDVWSGNASTHETKDKISFQGVRILDKVIEELLPEGLYHANHLLLAGSSAGGIGVILNLDRIADNLRRINSTVKVRGLADSGWYLNESPLMTGCPAGSQDCGPAKTIEQGLKYWNGVVPHECAKANPTAPWNCYFGPYAYLHLKTPLFVFQWLFDEIQLTWGQGTMNPTQEEVERIMSLSRNVTQSLKNITHSHVHAAFVPSCLSHAILTHSDWLKVRIGSCTLDDALERWFNDAHDHRDHHGRCRNSMRASCHCRRHHVIDLCRTPQCNKSCPPRYRNANHQRRRTQSSPKVMPNVDLADGSTTP